MPKKEIKILPVEIHLNIEEEILKYSSVKLSKQSEDSIQELVDEQRVIATVLQQREQRKEEKEDNIKRVFGILKESLDRAIADQCMPEPISAEKLLELYQEDIDLGPLVQRLKSYIKKEYENTYMLAKKQKNKKAAYILVRY